MKLFVDDIRNAPDESWTVARTINAAISAIDTFASDIEVISLDHDISHQVSLGILSRPYPCDETFTAVAFFIKEKFHEARLYHDMQKSIPEIKMSPEPKMPKIIIHTANPAGAVKLASILFEFEVERKYSKEANRLELEV